LHNHSSWQRVVHETVVCLWIQGNKVRVKHMLSVVCHGILYISITGKTTFMCAWYDKHKWPS